jgi:hypothetical protein
MSDPALLRDNNYSGPLLFKPDILKNLIPVVGLFDSVTTGREVLGTEWKAISHCCR